MPAPGLEHASYLLCDSRSTSPSPPGLVPGLVVFRLYRGKPPVLLSLAWSTVWYLDTSAATTRHSFRACMSIKVHEPRDDEGNVVEHDPIQLQVDKMDRLLTVADTKPVTG